ncbi:tetratricopeptide repeat protein [Edaphocola flava]|uniref:tetratricopeptide repeat protein n=1 Tax=Edaphocola flava TaxID=2499629 RepID=UPI00100A911E|nr:tetratricopeptide repeat protein [Edaphocola flava]
MFDDDWNDDDDFAGSIEELLKEYESIKKGESVRFWNEQEFELVIDYFYQNNQEAEALIACEIALVHHPFSSEFYILKAELLFQSQKYRQAISVLDELEAKDQPILEAVILRSDILVAQLKYDQAAMFLEQMSLQFSGKEKIEIMLELAEVYDECEQLDAVFDILKAILQIDPSNDEALHKICYWADFAEKQEESIALHQKLIDDAPYNALAWFNLGSAYQGLKLYEKAIDAYEYCVAIDDKFEFAYRNMADAYMRLKWYDKAIESLEKNLELGKPEDVIFEAIGHCFEKKKNYPKARHYYLEATRLNPTDDGIYFKIGQTYALEQQWEKALKQFAKAYELNKENVTYCLALGNCLLALNEGVEAISCFLTAVKLKTNFKKSWLALIRCLYLFGFYEEALEQLIESRNFCEQSADFLYYHSVILFAQGKTKDAMLKLEDALEEAPRKLKIVEELNADIMHRKAVIDLVAKYKKSGK